MIYLVTTDKEHYQFDESSDIKFAEPQDLLDYISDKAQLSVDTETTGLDCHTDSLICLQIGDYENQYIVDCQKVKIKLFQEDLESKILIMQNAKFDLKFFYKQGIFPTKIYDTYLAECVLNMGKVNIKKGLDTLAFVYCNVVLNKDIRKDIKRERLSERVVKYSADDIKFLEIIKEKQKEKLDKYNLHLALSLDNKFVRALAYVEFCGFKLDIEKWKSKMQWDLDTLEDSKQALDNFILDNPEKMSKYIESQLDLFDTGQKCAINWNSEKQVIPLMKELGVNTTIKDKHTGKLKESVDATVLLGQISKHYLVKEYMNYKKWVKVVTAFGESVLKQARPNTHRVHTQYRQLLDTGRMSCGGRDKINNLHFVNLQQIPADKSHRDCFIPEKGNKMIVADYSGQESVVFANFSKDPDIISFYQKGLADMHSFVAQKIYPELKDLDLVQIKGRHKDKRQNAKAAGFAIQYGGVGKTIATNLGLTDKEGEQIYESYFKAFPGVKKYFAICKNNALSKGYIELNKVSYRKSFISFFDKYKEVEKRVKEKGFWDKYREHKQNRDSQFTYVYGPLVRDYFKLRGNIERKSLNYPIQGSSAEITKYGASLFFDYLLEENLIPDVKICNIVHDEIVIECHKALAEDLAQTLKECMEKAGKPFCEIVPLKAEPCITDHWEH